ncbi:hypothetical protein PUR57_00050, partial [Streptomyces sp. JV176]|uniref:hypothetical protein n=1 Tax=Streptomyces sp. JV176 TaxID=858630 RepID=UPI002E7E9DE9|nr:hypothetical protein [Streptomyces sp. JV176]
ATRAGRPVVTAEAATVTPDDVTARTGRPDITTRATPKAHTLVPQEGGPIVTAVVTTGTARTDITPVVPTEPTPPVNPARTAAPVVATESTRPVITTRIGRAWWRDLVLMIV